MQTPGATNTYGRFVPDTFKGKGSYSFKVGEVERVFNDEVDYRKYNGKKHRL